MNFRCPNVHTHNSVFMLSPYGYFFCLCQSVDRIAFAKYNTVIFRYRCSKPIGSIRMSINIRICPLYNKWFIVFCLSVICFIHNRILLSFHCKCQKFFCNSPLFLIALLPCNFHNLTSHYFKI